MINIMIMDDYEFDFKSYSTKAKSYYQELLNEQGDDEKVFQKFFERNTSFLPGSHSEFGQAMSGHDPIHGCLISQPKIRGLNTRVPDFMWLSYDSVVFSPVLIEIEAPNKRLFNSDGTPTSNFTRAKNQLDEWRAHLSRPLNQLNFYEDYDIDLETRKLNFEPFYILIYGRRSEVKGNEFLTSKKRSLIDKSSQQRLISFDRLGPNEVDSQFSCGYVKERKIKLIALGQGVLLDDYESEYLANCDNTKDAIDEMMFTPDDRKTYLLENIEPFIERWKRGNV